MNDKITKIIAKHGLLPHPEGGHYKETYRSVNSTGIYYLLTEGDFSGLHKISSDEMWHFYGGDSLVVIEVNEEGEVISTLLNVDNPQYVVKSHRWFGAYLPKGAQFAFCGCTVSPAFLFSEFKLAKRGDIAHLSDEAKQQLEVILRD